VVPSSDNICLVDATLPLPVTKEDILQKLVVQ
jgi:hypothetical protein